MCQAFRRRDASQKRRRRRYAEAQHRQRPPVPGIIFDRERKGSSLSLSPFPLLFLIRRNPKRRDLSVTEGDDDDYDYDYDEEEDGIDEDSRRRGARPLPKCWIFLIASDRAGCRCLWRPRRWRIIHPRWIISTGGGGSRGALSLLPDDSAECRSSWDLYNFPLSLLFFCFFFFPFFSPRRILYQRC